MKKIKLLAVLLTSTLLITGCIKRDDLDNISVLTTTYPIEYLVENMYGYNSTINSLYPNGVNIREYKLTDKQLENLSNNTMIIYNSLTDERNIAASLLNYNKNIKAIDVAKGITIKRDEEELWLYPSNYLMLAQNIKNGLLEYSNSTIINQEVENNYDSLKLTISKYDAELKVIADKATIKTIVAGNDVFKYLEKYGFKVLSIEDNDLFVAAEFNEARNNIINKVNKTIFILENDQESENIKKLVELGGKTTIIKSMINRTEEEEQNDYGYEQMMEDFIETLKSEVYQQ